MSRNHLHVTHLEDFKKFLKDTGREFREGKGEYQILQVKHGKEWFGIYTRHEMKEHLTVDKRIDWLVSDFYKVSKGVAAVPKQEDLPFDL